MDWFYWVFRIFRFQLKIFCNHVIGLMRWTIWGIEWRHRYRNLDVPADQPGPYVLLNNMVALLVQFRALCLSDISFYKPVRFVDKLRNRRQDLEVAVVTGADRDVGKETAITLAKFGVKVIMGVKDLDEGNRIIDELKTPDDNDNEETVLNIRAIHLDLSSLKSVRQFAEEVTKMEPKIDLLVNSSEQLVGKLVITDDGFEKQFVANYLGHFLLTLLLVDNLKAATNARVINVSDMLHHIGVIDYDNLNLQKEYNMWLAYARSKLAQVLFTRELAERLTDSSVTVYAMNTNTWRQLRPFPDEDWRHMFNDWFKNISDPISGSQTVLYLALEDELKDETGYYYSNCDRIDNITNKTDEFSEKLWTISEEMVGIDAKLPKPVVIQTVDEDIPPEPVPEPSVSVVDTQEPLVPLAETQEPSVPVVETQEPSPPKAVSKDKNI